MEKKVKKVGSTKHVNRKAENKNEKLDRNGEVIVPIFRVKIAEQLCACARKLELLVPVLQKYDCSIAMYT